MYRDLPDFDTLLSLHKEDPQELDKVRADLTNAIFENASESSRRRLEGLQFRINMELRRARTPLAGCVKLSNMMHDSLMELHHTLNNPDIPAPTKAGKILPFYSERASKRRNH